MACADGEIPYGGLIFDEEGALYGTTTDGGSNGGGVAFKLTPPAPGQTLWKETVLFNFKSNAHPYGGLIFDEEGALYGTTRSGGSHNSGSVFKLTPVAGQIAWNGTALYSFTGGSDGGYPVAGLVFDAKGALYGTTANGGACALSGGCGVVFKLTPPAAGQTAWTETVLVNFSGANGIYSDAGLIINAKGALFGTTYSGGGAGGVGGGTVFKLPAVE
jgi:uncharacterized repeat protein (TIGR03803 family)